MSSAQALLGDSDGEPPVARTITGYVCAASHHFTRTFAADADIPTEWDCPRCGRSATPAGGPTAPPTEAPLVGLGHTVRPRISHFEHLMSRRTPQQADELLAEALAQLRGTG